MTKRSLAFGIILSVMFSVSWSAFAQTMSDKERLLGTWKLSEIEDDSGDRSGDIDKYLDIGTMTFRETAAPIADAITDTLDLYFSPKDSISTDDISVTGILAFEVDEAADSLYMIAFTNRVPSQYVFASDTLVTFVMADTTINGFIDRIKPFAALLGYGDLVPILDELTPYTGTASFTFTAFEGDVTSVDRADELPETSTLAQNYPNPFNPSTEIVYYLDESGPVRLEVFDVAGRLVGTLVDSVLPQGEHRARFAAGGLPTGTYVYRLTIGSGAKTLTKTMTIVR